VKNYLPGVDNVNDMRDILGRLFKLLDGLRYLALILAIAQVVAALLLIMNTVRLAAVNRREETGIMRLVGASSWSIQAPFILQSALAGFVGALLASGILLLGYQLIVADQLSQNYRVTAYIGPSAVWTTIPWIFLLGVGLASLASFLTLRRYLKV
jgi:cell division transport system permease protein